MIMKTIIEKNWYRTDVFEQVTEVPDGYSVWPIGRENFQHERCVPLAKDGKNEEEWQRNIDVTSLKYIEVKSEELALRLLKEAIRRGCDKARFYEIVNEY